MRVVCLLNQLVSLPSADNGTGTPAYGTNRYTALGLDDNNCSYAPLYADRANITNVTMG
eukprot:SAG22_NODE_12838_length_427_cov_1.426829_1_plen_58_part_10